MANRVTRKLVIAQCYEELDRVKSARSDDILYKVRSLLAQCDDELPELTEAAALPIARAFIKHLSAGRD
jgi:hypothetical protein